MPLKILNLDKICRVCLRNELDMKLIFDAQQNPTIAQMLSELTIYEVDRFPELPNSICLECFNLVLSAYKLKQQCERSHRTLIDLLDGKQKCTNSSSSCKDLTKNLREKCTQTEELCKSCHEKFSSYEALKPPQQSKDRNITFITCQFCSRSFDYVDNLEKHITVFHPESEYESYNHCYICKCQFRREHIRNVPQYQKTKTSQEVCNDEHLSLSQNVKSNNSKKYVEKPNSEKKLLKLSDETNLEYLMDEEVERPLAVLLNSSGATQIIEGELNESLIEDSEMLNEYNSKESLNSLQTTNNCLDISHCVDIAIVKGGGGRRVKQPIIAKFHTKQNKGIHKNSENVSDTTKSTPAMEGSLNDFLINDTTLKKPTRRNGQPTQQQIICQYCDKSFVSFSIIKRHMKADHVNEPFYFCKICIKNFTNNYDLVKHLSSEHKQNKQQLLDNQCYEPNAKGTQKLNMKNFNAQNAKSLLVQSNLY